MKRFGTTCRTWSAVLAAVLLVSSALIAGTAGSASAVTPPDPVAVPPFPQADCRPPFGPAVGPCMNIPTGGSVMDDVTAHLIFWLPPGYSFAPGVPDGNARHMA